MPESTIAIELGKILKLVRICAGYIMRGPTLNLISFDADAPLKVKPNLKPLSYANNMQFQANFPGGVWGGQESF